MEKIYTKAGDLGKSSTINRKFMSKSDPVFEILGTLDECSSNLGMAKAVANTELKEHIQQLQKDIQALSAIIAGVKSDFLVDCVKNIESLIDIYQEKGIGFHGFVTQGDNILSAYLDVARTIARRAERVAVRTSERTFIDKRILVYLNRLSDLLYCFARYADTLDIEETKTEKPKSSAVSSDINMQEMLKTVRNENMSIQNVNTNGLTLDIAKSVAAVVRNKAVEMGINVVISIVEKGSNLILLEAMDNSYLASVKISQDKAYTAVSLKMDTETVGELSQKGQALEGLVPTSENRIMFLAGGSPLKKGEQIYGGIGVSGGTAEEDKLLSHLGAAYFSAL